MLLRAMPHYAMFFFDLPDVAAYFADFLFAMLRQMLFHAIACLSHALASRFAPC